MKKLKWETLQVHAGYEPEQTQHCRTVPLYLTASYTFDNCKHAQDLFDLKTPGNIYTRIMNPTTDVLEKRVAAMDGGVGALAVASGMAAIDLTVATIARTGDHIVSASTVYGGTHNLFVNTFPTKGIEVSYVSPDDLDGFDKAVKNNTKAIFIESMSNPNCDLVDIEAVSKICKKHKIPLIVDNTFAPLLITPKDHGADIIIHSATKYICGHGTVMGGVIVDAGTFDWEKSGKFDCLVKPDPSYHGVSYTKDFGAAAFIVKARVAGLRDMGACISPFNSFMILQGMETLSLRMERHNFNTEKVIAFLSKSDKVEYINYPLLPGSRYYEVANKYYKSGAGCVVSFGIKGGKAAAAKFVDNLKLITHLVNVADTISLVSHPASTTHNQLSEEALLKAGIKTNTVRLSVGLEHYEDIIEDIAQSLDLL